MEQTLVETEPVLTEARSYRADDLVDGVTAARALGVSRVTIAWWFDIGKVRGVRIAGRRCYLRDDVERLARQRNGKQAESR